MEVLFQTLARSRFRIRIAIQLFQICSSPYITYDRTTDAHIDNFNIESKNVWMEKRSPPICPAPYASRLGIITIGYPPSSIQASPAQPVIRLALFPQFELGYPCCLLSYQVTIIV